MKTILMGGTSYSFRPIIMREKILLSTDFWSTTIVKRHDGRNKDLFTFTCPEIELYFLVLHKYWAIFYIKVSSTSAVLEKLPQFQDNFLMKP